MTNEPQAVETDDAPEPVALHNVLTRDEADAIDALRPVLKQAKRRIEDSATSNEPQGDESMWRIRMDAVRLGQLVAALHAAEDALFEVLNIAKNYTDCDQAHRVLQDEGQEL